METQYFISSLFLPCEFERVRLGADAGELEPLEFLLVLVVVLKVFDLARRAALLAAPAPSLLLRAIRRRLQGGAVSLKKGKQ